jgi:helix-turn-helix protein
MALMAEVRLAEYVNDSRDFDPVFGFGECFPGLEKLAEKVGVKKRQMIEILKELERSGEIQILRTSGRGNRYKVTPGSAAKHTSAENRTSAESCTGVMQPTTPDQCTGMHQTSAPGCTRTQEVNTGIENRKGTQGLGAGTSPPSLEPISNGKPVTSEPIRYEDFMDAWNHYADELGLAKVTELNRERKELILERFKEHPDVEWWKVVFARMRESKFLRGENHRNWKITFDFLITNSNALKIEGQYANGRNQRSTLR